MVEDEDVIFLDDKGDPFPVFALLREVGGKLAAEANASLIPRLVNTVKALNGEVVVVRMLSSMEDAEKWLLQPRLPQWLSVPAAAKPEASKGEDAVVVSVVTADGVIELSGDEDAGDEGADDDVDAAARRTFRRAALALPPAAPLNRTILSRASIQDSMLLPVSFQRNVQTGRVLGDDTTGPSGGESSMSSSLGASQLTPPTPSTSFLSEGSRSQARGDGLSLPARQPSQTCTPLPTSGSSPDGRPSKKLRPAEAVPFHMDRLAKAILRRKAGLFVTGGGGVGKTQLLRQCVDEHRQLHGGSRVGLHVVAPTGVAAAAAGGVTIHSFLRLSAGCFNESLSEQQDAARLYSVMDAMSKRRLAETSLLLLDEVSMVSSRMLTVLIYEIEMAHARVNNDVQWRVVVFGDFYQLPPVRGDEDNFDTSGQYAFTSSYWCRLFQNDQLQLRHVWRQEDKKLIKMLSCLRVGDCRD
eukprot:contig_3800_g829